MKGKCKDRTKRISLLALFISFAMILGYIESLIPIAIGIPGVKIGLPNLVIVIVLYQLTELDGWIVDFFRIIIVGLLFGNLFSICFSMVGGILSYLIMCILHRFKCHILTSSIAGGITHNIGQFVVALFLIKNNLLWYYYPWLMLTGLAAGVCNGILAGSIYRQTKRILHLNLQE